MPFTSSSMVSPTWSSPRRRRASDAAPGELRQSHAQHHLHRVDRPPGRRQPSGERGHRRRGPGCDFVTGGGFIVGAGASSLAFGASANFGVGGGVKNGAFWGHLEYNDHSTSPPMQVHGTSVTGYLLVTHYPIAYPDITGTVL